MKNLNQDCFGGQHVNMPVEARKGTINQRAVDHCMWTLKSNNIDMSRELVEDQMLRVGFHDFELDIFIPAGSRVGYKDYKDQVLPETTKDQTITTTISTF